MDHVRQALIRTANILYQMDQLPRLLTIQREHETFTVRYMPQIGYEQVEKTVPNEVSYAEDEIFAMLGRLKAAHGK